MVCLQVGVYSNYTIQGNRFASMDFAILISFSMLQASPTKVTQIIKNLSFLLLLLDVLFYYSIFSVSLLFYVPLFHFHPQGSPFYLLLFFFNVSLPLLFLFLALGVLLQLLVRKYFIYKQISLFVPSVF